jgi:hypothetical protein
MSEFNTFKKKVDHEYSKLPSTLKPLMDPADIGDQYAKKFLIALKQQDAKKLKAELPNYIKALKREGMLDDKKKKDGDLEAVVKKVESLATKVVEKLVKEAAESEGAASESEG